MPQYSLRLASVITSILMTGLMPLAAGAAPAATGVVAALQKKYNVTETTADRQQVTKDGTTMAMKCAGVYSLPSSAMIVPDVKVVDGKVQSPSMFTRTMWVRMGAHILQTGDKVYVTKIESKTDGGDELLRFTVLTTTDLAVQNSEAQKKFDGVVSFKFKKGYLDSAPPDEVEQVVESVLAPDTGDDKQADNSGGGQTQAAPKQQAAAPAPAPPPPAPVAAAPAAPAGPPPTITIGETSTEVLQAMGMPQQMIDLGKKKTYIYKNMKIIFVNDKVSDVQ